MAFCQACGAEVLDTAVVCIKCGSPLKKDSNICESAAEAWPKNKMWMYGILSFIIPIVGIILGIIGLTKEPRRIQGAILIGIALFGLGFWKGFLGA